MRLLFGLAAAGLFATATAQATTTTPVLVAGIYATNGIVTAVNNTAECGSAFIGLGGPVTSTIVYVPGKIGSTLSTYGAFNAGGYVQHCTFGAAFAFNGAYNGTCTTVAAGSPNAAPIVVPFTLTSTPIDTHTAIGSATLSIPASASAGAGCVATVATVLVYTGT